MEEDHAKRAYIPTRLEVVSLIFISLSLLSVVNILPALRASQINYSLYSDYARDFVEKLVAPIENQQTSNLMIMVLWGSVGIITYLLVWLLASVIHAYRNDLPPSKSFVMPEGIVQKNIWYSALGRALVRVLATVGFLYWLYLLIGSIFPFVSRNFLEAISELPRMWPLAVLSSVMLLAIGLYVAIILLRSIFLRERVFSS